MSSRRVSLYPLRAERTRKNVCASRASYDSQKTLGKAQRVEVGVHGGCGNVRPPSCTSSQNPEMKHYLAGISTHLRTFYGIGILLKYNVTRLRRFILQLTFLILFFKVLSL